MYFIVASGQGVDSSPCHSTSWQEDRKMVDTKQLWTGRVLSAFAVVFLCFDSISKLMRVQPVLDATARLGYPQGSIIPIGLLLLGCTMVYMIPRTAVVGAVLLTGYLGGAVATHVRVGNPLFETVFPIIMGSMIWAGILARDRRVRALIAPRGY
jgi:DoxX-like family